MAVTSVTQYFVSPTQGNLKNFSLYFSEIRVPCLLAAYILAAISSLGTLNSQIVFSTLPVDGRAP